MNNACEAFSPVRLIIYFLLALILGLSLAIPTTNEIWRSISLQAFYSMNGTLLLDQTWAVVIAFANTEMFNLFGAIAMALPTLAYLYFDKSADLHERLSRFGLGWLVVIIITILSKHGVPEIDHKSPTLVVDNFANINEIVPSIKAKYKSGHSFPGDHAVSGMTTIAIAFLLFSRKYAFWVAVMASIYIAPRLFTGAHWLSDAVVGGGMAFFITPAIVSSFPTLVWSRKIVARLITYDLVQKFLKLVRLT